MNGSLGPGVAALLGILALTSTSGAARQSSGSSQPTFSTGVIQVEVYATVTDRQGRPVTGLTREDFALREDEVAQTLTSFSPGDFPASIALGVDRSFSMRGPPLELARTAARSFVGRLRASDRATVIGIGSEVEALTPLTGERQILWNALGALDIWGTTSLNDAIVRSLELLDDEQGRRALVLLSDGVDKYSASSDGVVLDRARRADVLMYPIALGRDRPRLFVELAAVSGGRSFHVREPSNLPATLDAIAEEIHAQYLLGYSPARATREDEDGWRSISVTVKRPDVTVRTRSGYSVR